MTKENLIKKLIELEGDYVDDPRDSGGATKYGITEAVARKHGFQGNMKYLSYETAYDIYEKDYWNAFKGDELVKLDSELIEMLLETSALCGVYRTSVWLQRCLNVLNNQGKYYPDIKVDGKVGDMTFMVLKKHLSQRKSSVVLRRMLNNLAGYHYFNLAETRMKDEAFIYGWFLNRVK